MNTKLLSFASVVLSLSLAPTAFGSGFEKSVPWGGATSGLAGIGTPYMEGSQALFFNPAGLLGDKKGQDVTFNVSPTMPKFSAPIFNAAKQENSDSKTLFPAALIYGHTLNDKIGYGVGFYVAGGLATEFKNQALSPFKGTFNPKSALTITELALGAGYKVMPNLKVGASWRVGMASAEISSINATEAAGGKLYEENYSDLKGNNYLGFKLGAQYKLNDDTQFGFTYRGEMNYEVKGKINVLRHTPVNVTGIVSDQDVTMGTTLPAAWTLGATHKLNQAWDLYGEYVFTEYSKVDNIATDYSGNTPILLKWKDQHNLRLAANYSGFHMPIRFGFVWTSDVTNADHALPTMIPPGSANTFTLGTGHQFGAWKVDGGFEYTTVSGKATGKTLENEVTEYALHLGTTYSF